MGCRGLGYQGFGAVGFDFLCLGLSGFWAWVSWYTEELYKGARRQEAVIQTPTVVEIWSFQLNLGAESNHVPDS